MNAIEFRNVYKSYGEHEVLADISFDVRENEFFVIFGPSGAGKTTILKLIAGLDYVDSGSIFVDGKDATVMPAAKRGVRMAFENYALYPHLTVFENMAGPLRNNKLPMKEIKERVEQCATTLGIRDYLNRLPRELSGGQRQRVSLGRSIVAEARVYLLDEPLAHLDAKLRHELRTEFQDIKSILGNCAVVCITHNYVQAMGETDRVCVLADKQIQQIDTPKNIYDHPINVDTALMFGYPPINLLNMKVDKDRRFIFNDEIKLGPFSGELAEQLSNYDKEEIIYGVRPRNCMFSFEDRSRDGYIKGEVIGFEINNFRGILLVQSESSGLLSILCDRFLKVTPGADVFLKPDISGGCFFDATTKKNLKYQGDK